MKKILVIALDFGPEMGSEARFAYSWVKSLEKYHRVQVITDIKNKNNLKEMDKRIKIFYCRFVTEGIRTFLERRRLYNLLSRLFMRKVKKLLKKQGTGDIDLIHCLTPAGIYAYNNLYRFGKPVVSGPLGGGLKLPANFRQYESAKYRARQVYYRLIKLNPNWINYYKHCLKILIGTSNLLLHLPQETHYKTVEFFDTVVDVDEFRPGTGKTGNPTTIVYSGRLDAGKGCLLLMEAFRSIVKSGYENVRLILLGGGPEYENILKFTEENNLQAYVSVTGSVPIGTVNDCLRNADIFCLPSLKEPGGTSILEAMACALPVVTSDYGGPAMSVSEDCGIKIKPDEYEKFLNKLKTSLIYLIENREVRERMGLNARKRAVEKYSCQSLEKRIKDLYDNIFHTPEDISVS